MGDRGPEAKTGLLWHKKGGWYHRYDGKPIYFGGGGSIETSYERKGDRSIKYKAYQSWVNYESEHHFGETKK